MQNLINNFSPQYKARAPKLNFTSHKVNNSVSDMNTIKERKFKEVKPKRRIGKDMSCVNTPREESN